MISVVVLPSCELRSFHIVFTSVDLLSGRFTGEVELYSRSPLCIFLWLMFIFCLFTCRGDSQGRVVI